MHTYRRGKDSLIIQETVRKSGKHRIRYGNETIEYSLSYSKRARLSIVLEPSGTVEVCAPLDAEFEVIDALFKIYAI